MAHRTALSAAVIFLVAACSPTDRSSPDAAAPVEGGTDVRDAALPDAGEGGFDPPDVASTDADASDGDADARDGSDATDDGREHDGDAVDARDGDGAPTDGDAAIPDPDADASDADAGADSDAPPISCEWTQERLYFSVALPDGVRNCGSAPTDAGYPPPIVQGQIAGVVRSIATDAGSTLSITIDTCVGDACSPQEAVIHLQTSTPFTLPIGAFVQVDYRIARPWACTWFLNITNLPELNGQRNPVSDVAKTYVVASDGTQKPTFKIGSTDVVVSTNLLGCPTDGGVSCGSQQTVGTYVFEFAASGATSLTAPMGQSVPWTVSGQNLIVRNHRSYSSGWCDDYWNWAFTILGQ